MLSSWAVDPTAHELRRLSSRAEVRAAELAALTDPGASSALARLGIKLVTYATAGR